MSKILKRAAAVVGVAGTMAGVWWFAFGPRKRKRS